MNLAIKIAFLCNTTNRDVATLGSAGWLRPALEPTTRHSERFKVFQPALIMVN